jgi:hypothetical protein
MFWEGRIPIATAADADVRTAHDPMTFGVGGCAQVTMRSMNHQVIIGAYWAYLFGSVAGLDLSPTLRLVFLRMYHRIERGPQRLIRK